MAGDIGSPRLIMAGSYVCALLALTFHAASNSDELAMGVLLPMLPATVFTSLMFWRERPSAYVAAGLSNVGVPVIVIVGLGKLQILSNPLAGPEFATHVLLALSLALAVPAAWWGYLRGAATARPVVDAAAIGSRRRMYVVGAVCAATGLIVAGLLATIQAVEITSQGALDFDAPSSLTVLAKRTLFAPSMFDVPVGTPMEIRVVNEDALYHTFTYREGSALMSRDILPLSTSRFIVTVDDAGPLEFWCVPHEGTMRGTMTGV